MAKTILRVRQDGVAFFLNEVSTGTSNSGKRYRLSRTSDYGKTKDGWVKVNVTQHQVLIQADSEMARFNACADLYASKDQRPYVKRHHIRGMAEKWEGEAFPKRVIHGREATLFTDNENVSRHERR